MTIGIERSRLLVWIVEVSEGAGRLAKPLFDGALFPPPDDPSGLQSKSNNKAG